MNTYATHSDFHSNGEIKWHWTGFGICYTYRDCYRWTANIKCTF